MFARQSRSVREVFAKCSRSVHEVLSRTMANPSYTPGRPPRPGRQHGIPNPAPVPTQCQGSGRWMQTLLERRAGTLPGGPISRMLTHKIRYIGNANASIHYASGPFLRTLREQLEKIAVGLPPHICSSPLLYNIFE